MDKGCPTEVLIDIKDDKYTSCTYKKEIETSLSIVKSKIKTERSNSEGNKSLKSIDSCKTVFDMSPSRISEASNDKATLVSEVGPKQSLKSEIADNCPTAVLIDVSPTGFYSRDNYLSSSTLHFKDALNRCKSLNIGNQDSRKKWDKSSNQVNDCKTGDSDNSSNSSETELKVPVKRLRWKTPSPQSMSRICKEASKVIDHLNSSSIFDDDLLLTEEILPVTLNFDELDDDTDLGNSGDSVCDDVIFNHHLESSISKQQSLNKIEKIDDQLNCDSSLKSTSGKIHSNLKKAFMETNIIEAKFQVSGKNNSDSKETYPSGIRSNSLNSSGSVTHCNEADDDVFSVTNFASEDKENVCDKKKTGISSKENKIGGKITSKNFSSTKSKIDQRGTLRNVSNIKQDASARRLSFSVNRNVTTPLKRMSISASKRGDVPNIEKLQIKKTMSSVDSLSKSFQFQNKKVLTSSVQKSRPTRKFNAGCSSLSSDVKQQNVFATPSRRYSICTPLKSASAMKPPSTPAPTSSHSFLFPRYTPQPSRPSRLSFSRSWQQSGDNFQSFPAKGLKQQVSTTVPSSASKVAFGIKNLSKPGKVSFSQSMSSMRSTGKNTNTGRFCSKVPSPLSLEKDKKVARALFTSISEK